MEIKIAEGCTAYCTLVDDKRIDQMKDDEIRAFIDYLLLKVKEGIMDGTISFNRLIELFQYDKYEEAEHTCEQCGDTVTTTTWNL